MYGNGARQGAQAKAGLFSILSTPILVIVIALGIFAYNLVGTISAISNGGNIVVTQEAYDQHIANIEKAAISEGQDKNGTIILTFFYDVDTNTVTPDMKAGSNIMNEVTDLLSKSEAYDSVKTYESTFVSNLIAVLNKMATDIQGLELNSNFIKKYDPAKLPEATLVQLEGKSHVDDSAGTLDAAIKSFSEKTGIALIVSVDSSADVFGRSAPWKDILIEVALLAFAVYMIFNIVKKVRAYKQIQEDLGSQPQEPVVKKSLCHDDDDEDEEEDEEEEDETKE